MTDGPLSRRQNPTVVGIVLALSLLCTFALLYWSRRGKEVTDDAYVEAHAVSVTSKVAAYVSKLLVDDNSSVVAGNVLVELDPRDYDVQAELARARISAAESELAEVQALALVAKANANEAEAELTVARTRADLAARDLGRLKAVSDPRAVSAERLDTAFAAAESDRALATAADLRAQAARAQVGLAHAQISMAEASLIEADAQLSQANLNLSYTTIAAPESGTVANKIVQAGNYVQSGQLLFLLVPNKPFVVANFKETQLTWMRPGQPASIQVDAFPSVRFRGHVGSIQRGTGSRFALLPPENATGNFVKVVQRVPVKILFDGPREALALISPGMSAEVSVQVGK